MPPETTRRPLYLDDLTVGDIFESGTHHLDAEQIINFAKQFDPQDFHIDPEAADDSFFHGLAASGWHTSAISMRLLVDSVPFANGVIGAGGEIAWPTPTRPGDILRVRSEIQEIRPSRSRPNQALAFVRSLTLNQDDVVRQELTARLLVFRKER